MYDYAERKMNGREREREGRTNCVSTFVSVGCFVGVALRSCAGIFRAAVQKRGISGSSCVTVRGLLAVDGVEGSRDRSARVEYSPIETTVRLSLPSSVCALRVDCAAQMKRDGNFS